MRDAGDEPEAQCPRHPDVGPVVVVRGDGREVLLCRVADLGRANLATVDVLARLQLEARRRGWSLELRDPGDEPCALRDLIGLVGLTDLLDGSGPTSGQP